MNMEHLRIWRRGFLVALVAGGIATRLACGATEAQKDFPNVPKDYLREADNPPDFWVSTVDGVTKFLAERVHKGTVEVIGESAGGRPIRAVFYGSARSGKGTTTFSGALGARRVS